MDMFTKKISRSLLILLSLMVICFTPSCNETKEDLYYGFNLTITDDYGSDHYKIPQESSFLSVQNNGANYDVFLMLMVPTYKTITISATNVNQNNYLFNDSAITFTAGFWLLGFFETNYSTERYTLAEGAINFHSLDTTDFHCTFDYKFTYTDSTHVGEPFYTNTIHITDADVRIKK